jgi:hypothetical protein
MVAPSVLCMNLYIPPLLLFCFSSCNLTSFLLWYNLSSSATKTNHSSYNPTLQSLPCSNKLLLLPLTHSLLTPLLLIRHNLETSTPKLILASSSTLLLSTNTSTSTSILLCNLTPSTNTSTTSRTSRLLKKSLVGHLASADEFLGKAARVDCLADRMHGFGYNVQFAGKGEEIANDFFGCRQERRRKKEVLLA